MSRLRTHGITRVADEMEQRPEGAWVYEMQELGFNYRLTDIQAALGSSQLKRVDEYVRRRAELADRYERLLRDRGLLLPQRDAASRSAWHLYAIGWNEAVTGASRATVLSRLREEGIGVNVHYTPVHLQPYYRRLGFGPGQFPKAETYYANCLTLPLHAGLTEAQQDRIVQNLLAMLR
jgi:dTDP-4-amino-4,6-dideoxygalactose transaminase